MLSYREFISEEKTYSDKEAHDKFMFGHCRSFAKALHNKIGGEVRALHRDGKTLHVYVHKDGKNYDHKGPRSHASMIKNMVGSLEDAHKWSEHPVDHEKMKVKDRMVDHATRYIDHNKKRFSV